MRIVTLAAVIALAVTGAANAQSPAAPSSPPSASPQAPATAPAIKSVSVVDIDALPEPTKAKLNQAIASRTADELQRLRDAIEAAPAIKSALEAKGLSSRDVVVAQIDDAGELTIVTRKAG